MKRFYHDDGRAFSEEECEASVRERAKDKDFRIRTLKDFLIIYFLSVLYGVFWSYYLEGAGVLLQGWPKVLETLPFVFIVSGLTNFVNALIGTAVFVFSIRQKKSRLLFMFFSVLLPFGLVFIESLTSGTILSCVGETCTYENGKMTVEGLYRNFFGQVFWLTPLVALVFFIYNPFKDMRN